MNKIIYITSYNSAISERDLEISLAEKTCSEYIISCFKQEGYVVNVLSTGVGKKRSYFTTCKRKIDNSEIQYFFPSLKAPKSYVLKILNQFLVYTGIFLWLLFKSEREDIVLVYHNNLLSHFYGLMGVLNKNLSFVVGELYSAVYNKGYSEIEIEKRRLQKGKRYIFANDIMAQRLEKEDCSTVCYGNTSFLGSSRHVDKSIIKIVYAGKIETGRVSDAFVAVETARYLPHGYEVSIIGYGSDTDIEKLRQLIEEINKERDDEIVSYNGCLYGTELDDFIMDCDIGLCPRVLDDNASDYCFPSKTLVYMTHGVIPLCPKLKNLYGSKVSSGILFIQGELTPENIAKTIVNHKNGTQVDYKVLLDGVDKDFRFSINKLFN